MGIMDDILSQGSGGGYTAAPTTGAAGTDAVGSGVHAAIGEVGGVLHGRITLAALDAIVLGFIVFYLATKRVQGGG